MVWQFTGLSDGVNLDHQLSAIEMPVKHIAAYATLEPQLLQMGLVILQIEVADGCKRSVFIFPYYCETER
jgi:hypothetical protein